MGKKKQNKWNLEYTFGKEVLISSEVVPIEPDEDLKLFAKCCEEVCKIFNEVKKNNPQD